MKPSHAILLVIIVLLSAALTWSLLRGSSSGRDGGQTVVEAASEVEPEGLPPIPAPPVHPLGDIPPPNGAPDGKIPHQIPSMPGNQEAAKRFLEQREANRDKLLAPFGIVLNDMNLSEEQSAKVLKVLSEHQSKIDQQMANALTGQPPPPIEEMVGYDNERDQKLMEVLGEEGFEEYQAGVETLPERIAIERLELTLNKAGTPLTTAQSDQIYEAMVSAVREQKDASSGTPLQPGLMEEPRSERFDAVSEALRAQTAVLDEQQMAEVERFIEETKSLRERFQNRSR